MLALSLATSIFHNEPAEEVIAYRVPPAVNARAPNPVSHCSFPCSLISLGLDSDPALSQLAAAIHFLDVGGISVDDAKGLETILKGARDKARSDDELVLAAARVFDHVYSAYRSTENMP